ncbi:MAG: peptide chain release factor 1, partial [Tenericutes bacterium]|nr:peptide chain release factor 1 [Mycoplasmatota bacterium]
NYTVMHLDKIMEGEIEEVIQALIAEDEKRKLGEHND